MGNGTRLLFNPFVLDTPNQSLLGGTEKIVLRPKTFAVPSFLVRNPHRLVTKTEIMAALWPGSQGHRCRLAGQHLGEESQLDV
jgi:DNA-binding winged helix-turn-helix (wHTH) protein